MKANTDRPYAWSNLKYTTEGLCLIDFQQFSTILKATVTVGDDHGAVAWGKFCEDRLLYCLTRDPPEQGYALVNLALALSLKIPLPG